MLDENMGQNSPNVVNFIKKQARVAWYQLLIFTFIFTLQLPPFTTCRSRYPCSMSNFTFNAISSYIILSLLCKPLRHCFVGFYFIVKLFIYCIFLFSFLRRRSLIRHFVFWPNPIEPLKYMMVNVYNNYVYISCDW